VFCFLFREIGGGGGGPVLAPSEVVLLCVFSFTPDLKIVFCFLVLLGVSVVLFMVVTDLVWWFCGDARDSGGGSVLAGPLWFGVGFSEFVSLLENCLFQTEFSDGLDFV
jgi:hypothetical protein